MSNLDKLKKNFVSPLSWVNDYGDLAGPEAFVRAVVFAVGVFLAILVAVDLGVDFLKWQAPNTISFRMALLSAVLIAGSLYKPWEADDG